MSLAIDQSEALNLLTRSTHGYRESILLAHGFPIDMLQSLVRDGLVIAEREAAYLRPDYRGGATSDRLTSAGVDCLS